MPNCCFWLIFKSIKHFQLEIVEIVVVKGRILTEKFNRWEKMAEGKGIKDCSSLKSPHSKTTTGTS